MTQTEWHHLFLLDKMYKPNFNGQQIPAPDNEFENINHHVV